METPKFVRSFYEVMKHQRLACSCALIIGLFLVLMGHAPVLPVIAGCALGIAMITLRSWPMLKAKKIPSRSGR